ncbi:MAG TPA: ATP-grasp domain-containing protein [Bryobacteraceae bacterium]|nr:ATP-grasp domain-containing protein [Bryobacteraceae bacterium]
MTGHASRRVLLFAATTGYQIRMFDDAARRLGVDLTLATDRCPVLDDPWGDRAIPVRFGDVPASLEALRGRDFDGIAAVGDAPAVLAAEAACLLGVPFHPPAAARACHDKNESRRLFQKAGLPVPRFFRAPLAEPPESAAERAPYPCVLKPLGLSASRGVIRANDPREFATAFHRIRRLVGQDRYLQVEAYIPGREFAVEGIVTHGAPCILAIFDKPDPLEGPFFEETIYVTPSRESPAVQQVMRKTVERAVQALGLYHGPFHAELRYNDQGAWMLEVAARPIGGLCARTLRPLEELIVRHAVGEDISGLELDQTASGVMMIPIPRAGVFQGVAGTEDARAVEGIEDVIISAKEGQMLVPLPEGATYLGFIFARAGDPAAVERSLRRAHAALRFRIGMALPAFSPAP